MAERDSKGRFVNGNSGGGRPKLSDATTKARNMAYEDLIKTIIKARKMTVTQFQKLDPLKIPLGERAIINAYATLDYMGVKNYEDRLFGKAKDSLEVDLGDQVEKVRLVIKETNARHRRSKNNKSKS